MSAWTRSSNAMSCSGCAVYNSDITHSHSHSRLVLYDVCPPLPLPLPLPVLSYRTLPTHIGEQMNAAVKSYHTMKALAMPSEYLTDLKHLNHELCVVSGRHVKHDVMPTVISMSCSSDGTHACAYAYTYAHSHVHAHAHADAHSHAHLHVSCSYLYPFTQYYIEQLFRNTFIAISQLHLSEDWILIHSHSSLHPSSTYDINQSHITSLPQQFHTAMIHAIQGVRAIPTVAMNSRWMIQLCVAVSEMGGWEQAVNSMMLMS